MQPYNQADVDRMSFYTKQEEIRVGVNPSGLTL